MDRVDDNFNAAGLALENDIANEDLPSCCPSRSIIRPAGGNTGCRQHDATGSMDTVEVNVHGKLAGRLLKLDGHFHRAAKALNDYARSDLGSCLRPG